MPSQEVLNVVLRAEPYWKDVLHLEVVIPKNIIYQVQKEHLVVLPHCKPLHEFW